MIDLMNVRDFGEIAAGDDDLRRYFVQTPVYNQLVDGDRQVVIGRKGSGKTALYLSLVDRASNSSFYAEGLTFGDYPWALHNQYANESTTTNARFQPSWKFLTALQIFKIILTDKDREARYRSSKEAKQALKEVEKFIESNWGVVAFDYKKTFPSGGFRLDGLSVEPQAAGFGLGGVDVRRTGARLGETLDRLNEWLWHALDAVAKYAPRVFVLFDELDSGYDPNSEAYVDRVTGLLLSCSVDDQGVPLNECAVLPCRVLAK